MSSNYFNSNSAHAAQFYFKFKFKRAVAFENSQQL